MEKEKKNSGLIVLLIIIIVILAALCILFAIGTISFITDKVDDNSENTNSLAAVCTAEVIGTDKLEILSMENKTEKSAMVGGSGKGYNVTTTVTKEHDYTSTIAEAELYANDSFGTLFVLYENKVYYTNQKTTISKYCEAQEINDSENLSCNNSEKLKCDYSKFNDNNITEFNVINIDVNLKSIGSYGNSGSCSLVPYAITTDGEVIRITGSTDDSFESCEVMYDDATHPIDRIFNLRFYDGTEYKILLKDGTLITRDVDREHPIELESN